MPVFLKRSKAILGTKDVYRTLKEHKSDNLGNKIWASWKRELKNSKGKPNLLRALLRVFGWQFGILGLVTFLVELGLRTLQPMLLLELISYFVNKSEVVEKGYYYAGGLIISSFLGVIIIHPAFFGIQHLCFKMRIAIGSMIYRKALRLSNRALADSMSGHVLNLISNDVARLDSKPFQAHYLWIGPLQTLVISFLMYQEIGIAALFGVAFMVLFIPLQLYMGRITAVLRLRAAKRTDKRMRLINEIISGIQVIKMYAWELPFQRIVAYARKKEINTITQGAYLYNLTLAFQLFISRVSIFLSLVGYVILGRLLSPEVAFLITAYYNVLQNSMIVYFPFAINQSAQIIVSMKRIENFMLLDEVKQPARSPHLPTEENKDEAEEILLPPTHSDTNIPPLSGISISRFAAKWDHNSPDYALSGINLKIQPGSLVCITGPTGSGKSSLIQAILGELQAECGQIEVNGSLSYASQEPWLFSGTVRQNILFGKSLDRRRYASVVKSCALERDFELLPLKDKTIVGDRGASLSGGQRARICLARAVYREASIYLLDDPLSAVDSNVARHLFEECFRGYLRGRTVVLVTHQQQFLQQADQILVLDRGQLSAEGTYESLLKEGVTMLGLAEKEDPEDPEDLSICSNIHKEQRRNSEKSEHSIADSCPEKVNVEHQASGGISLSLYRKYFQAGGGFFACFFMISCFLIAQGVISLSDYFLTYWVSKKRQVADEGGTAVASHFISWLDIEWSVDSETMDMYIFTMIMVLTIILSVASGLLLININKNASIRLHNTIFNAIMRASKYFFSINDHGRIMNRFSKDMSQVDEVLPELMLFVALCFLLLAGVVVVLAIVNPILLIPTLVIGIVFHQLQTFYLKTATDLKRIEAVSRSPVYSHLVASLSGLSTIRAFRAQDILELEFDHLQDMHSSALYMFITTSRFFGYWLDCLCVLYIAVITLSFFVFPPANGGYVGLAITQVLGLTTMVQFAMRQAAELNNTMISVERVIEYEDIEPEGSLEAPADKKPPQSWPEQGKIVFDELSLRYRPDPKAENVLKSLSFVIKPREKIGIVGRTDAGKSSLINALFRLSYNDGSVLIDKRDTNEMGLHDLRSKISIIPQEPVLFSGTMRYNLDPFEEYSDEKLWHSLEEVQLKEVVANMEKGLETKITEGGSNFSVGQRQLVCVARAILRDNRILVMDEATANVDPQTDALIQDTIRNKFKDCTVLTIAHRLHTIMDSNKVLVMDAGRAVEFGTPYELLTAGDSKVFLDMVKQTGQASYDGMMKIAQKAFESVQH
ncbi:probable multidrug resistance-associated protein lethal(2)03659 [Drosophila takahashii]|uniref:probable multidrug resistance-associated protein lethal(2)03659 n=1 Tax=Drosophila takahashii TaxID=29030 RepID=UPI001CF88CF5|nr:probable multidrug resistance-associated protein lethal(2)03659 [Drosophila takahashii]